MEFCKAPFEDMYIKEDYVKLCPWMENSTILGNPLVDTMEDMWTSEKAERVRDSIRDGSFKWCNKETCPKCSSGRMDIVGEQEAKEYKALVSPRKLNVSYDRFCNHVCPSCRSSFFKPDDAYRDKMKKLKEAILPFANQVEILSTCGMGDCFASPFIMEFLKELRPQNPKFFMSFETNGVYVDERHWNELSHLHQYPMNFTITPNSFDKYTYRYLSGGIDDLEKCKDSLKFVSRLRKENKIASFKINMVVQEANYWEIPAFIQYCLEEYDPDIIQIKPLNRWFCLDAEGYWFKNVLNPKHPYHKNYLEVMKDPILQHPKVWDWTSENHDRDARRHPSFYSEVYVDFLNKLLFQEGFKREVEEKIRLLAIKNIAIYGVWKYGEICYDVLKDFDSVSIKYFIDKRKGGESKTFMGYDVKGVFRENFNDVDTIFVTALAAKQEIERDIEKVGYKGKIISIYDFL